MQNTIAFTQLSTNKRISFTVTDTNKPFNNNFSMMGVKRFVRTRNGRDAVAVLVKCTKDSMEEGRIYYCVYTYKGTLLECHTVN